MVIISSEIKKNQIEKASSGDKEAEADSIDSEFLQKNEYFDAEVLSKKIGLAVASGFILMLIIDQISEVIV